jgi:outer membrane receptor protein involved in Fe transport
MNYRSSYLRTAYDGKNAASKDGFDGTVYVDAAAFFNVTDRVRLTLDAINLTNETEVQYNSIYHRLHNETRSGTTVFAGIGVKF